MVERRVARSGAVRIAGERDRRKVNVVRSRHAPQWAVPMARAYRCDPKKEEECDDDLLHAGSEWERAAERELRLSVAGHDVGACRLAASPDVHWDRPPALSPWRAEVMKGTEVWCVFDVPLSAGSTVPLVLEFTGSLEYADYVFHGERTFAWEVLPGGAPRQVSARVEVDAGRMEGLVRLKTAAGVTWTGRRRASRGTRAGSWSRRP